MHLFLVANIAPSSKALCSVRSVRSRYIHDLEFRECLQAIADRAKRLQREQEAFKETLGTLKRGVVGFDLSAKGIATRSKGPYEEQRAFLLVTRSY